MEQEPNNTQAAIDAGMKLGAAPLEMVGGVPATLTPKGFELTLRPELMDAPLRTKAEVSTLTADSFIEYFNKYSDDKGSAIFCDVDAARFLGIIDHHDVDDAAWCEHKVGFTCKQTKEWQAWLSSNGEKMDQTAFSFFIENNLEEIVEPPGAQMLEIATSLRAKTKVNFTSAKRLSDGQTQFEYIEEQEGGAGAKGEIKIPETFRLGMRVFEGGEAYEILARFRYRIKEGNVVMWYDLVRPHKVHQAAVEDVFEDIKERAECELIVHGNP